MAKIDKFWMLFQDLTFDNHVSIAAVQNDPCLCIFCEDTLYAPWNPVKADQPTQISRLI